MSDITRAILSYDDVIKLDEFERVFELVTNIDCVGKTFIFQVRRNPGDTLILDFKESDNSLHVSAATAIPNTDKTSRTITLYKSGSNMNVNPSIYKCGLSVYTDESDKTLLTTGYFAITNEIPQIPTI